jgi:hypothetical protein
VVNLSYAKNVHRVEMKLNSTAEVKLSEDLSCMIETRKRFTKAANRECRESIGTGIGFGRMRLSFDATKLPQIIYLLVIGVVGTALQVALFLFV